VDIYARFENRELTDGAPIDPRIEDAIFIFSHLANAQLALWNQTAMGVELTPNLVIR
jgi:hypothetical protein